MSLKNVFAIGLLTVSCFSQAELMLDGKYDGSKYQLSFNMGIKTGGNNVLSGGAIHFGTSEEMGNHFLYISLPKTYVDNTWGQFKHEDWNNHTFKHLVGSDVLGTASNPNFINTHFGRFSLEIDYLMTLEERINKKKVIVGYASDAFVNSRYIESLINVKSSLEYNLDIRDISPEEYATSGKNNTVTGVFEDSPEDTSGSWENTDDWLYDVAYEVEFDASLFSKEDWLSQTPEDMLIDFGEAHVSPAKNDYGFYGYDITYDAGDNIGGIGGGNGGDHTTPVPLTGSLTLLALSLIGLRRKIVNRKK